MQRHAFRSSDGLNIRGLLEQLRKQAKDVMRNVRAGDASALARMTATAHTADAARISLTHVHLAIALEYGFPSWPKLVSHVEATTGGISNVLIPNDLQAA